LLFAVSAVTRNRSRWRSSTRSAVVPIEPVDPSTATPLGNIEITIPPEVAVECDGDSFMGTFTLKYSGRASPSLANREKVVRITGSAYAGAVTVSVKGPDDDFTKRIKRNLGFGD
jgi:hypothetical protein